MEEGSAMDKVSKDLELATLNKQSFRRTIDELHDRASSILLMTLQWKDIEEHFDSTTNSIEERRKELLALEESVRGKLEELRSKEEKLLAVEAREKELDGLRKSVSEKLSELEKKQREFDEKQKVDIEKRCRDVEWMERSSSELRTVERSVEEKLRELDSREKEFVLIKESIQKQREEVDLSLKQLKGGVSKELELKSKELESKYEEKFKELEFKKKEFEEYVNGFDSSNEKKFKDLELQEKINDEWILEIEKKEKQLEERCKELEKREGKLIGGQDRETKVETVLNVLAKKVLFGEPKSGKCLQIYLNEIGNTGCDELVKKDVALAFQLLALDPAKLVLDAMEGFYPPHLKKGDHEFDGSVSRRSCILLLEQFMKMNLKIEPRVQEEASKLAVDWFNRATDNLENMEEVLGCLLLIAAYDLASTFNGAVLFKLFECVAHHDQAPALLRYLGLTNKLSGVIEALIAKEQYFPAIRFICEFKLFKEFQPGPLLWKYLNASRKAARKIAGPGNKPQVQNEFQEKRRSDALLAVKYIEGKGLQSLFPMSALRDLLATLEKQLERRKEAMAPAPAQEKKPVQPSREKMHGSITSEAATPAIAPASASTSTRTLPPAANALPAINTLINHLDHETSSEEHRNKRQRTTEPREATVNTLGMPCTLVQTPHQNPTEYRVVPSHVKIEGSVKDIQVESALPSSRSGAQTRPNVSADVNGELLRLLLENRNNSGLLNEASHTFRDAADPAKLLLDTVMVLYPSNLEGDYEFKLRVSSDSCFFLLKQLRKVSPQIEPSVREAATRLAVAWKLKLLKKNFDRLETICFILFLGIYKLVSIFKADELLCLLENNYWCTVSPDLGQFTGLDAAIPDFIQNLIQRGQHIKAIKYIYSLDVICLFPPVPLLHDFLRYTKESADKSCKKAKNVSEARVAATNRQIRALRDANKCITKYKLESQFPTCSLLEQLNQLLKQRDEQKLQLKGPKSESNVNPTSNLSHQTNKKKSDEVATAAHPYQISTSVPATSTSAPLGNPTPCTPTVSKTQSSKRSRRGKRRPWGNEQARSYSLGGNSVAASHASNYHNSNSVPQHTPIRRADEYNRWTPYSGYSNTAGTSQPAYIHWQVPYASCSNPSFGNTC